MDEEKEGYCGSDAEKETNEKQECSTPINAASADCGCSGPVEEAAASGGGCCAPSQGKSTCARSGIFFLVIAAAIAVAVHSSNVGDHLGGESKQCSDVMALLPASVQGKKVVFTVFGGKADGAVSKQVAQVVKTLETSGKSVGVVSVLAGSELYTKVAKCHPNAETPAVIVIGGESEAPLFLSGKALTDDQLMKAYLKATSAGGCCGK